VTMFAAYGVPTLGSCRIRRREPRGRRVPDGSRELRRHRAGPWNQGMLKQLAVTPAKHPLPFRRTVMKTLRWVLNETLFFDLHDARAKIAARGDNNRRWIKLGGRSEPTY
jgi:hypothetical protein